MILSDGRFGIIIYPPDPPVQRPDGPRTCAGSVTPGHLRGRPAQVERVHLPGPDSAWDDDHVPR